MLIENNESFLKRFENFVLLHKINLQFILQKTMNKIDYLGIFELIFIVIFTHFGFNFEEVRIKTLKLGMNER